MSFCWKIHIKEIQKFSTLCRQLGNFCLVNKIEALLFANISKTNLYLSLHLKFSRKTNSLFQLLFFPLNFSFSFKDNFKVLGHCSSSALNKIKDKHRWDSPRLNFSTFPVKIFTRKENGECQVRIGLKKKFLKMKE